MALAALIVSIVAVVATAFGVYVTRKATDVERDRRHAEMRPRFLVRCVPQAGTDRQTLEVKLLGPGELEAIDEITVTIRDDNYFRLKQPGAPDQLWSPYRFVPRTGPGVGTRGGQGADEAGRATTSEGLPVGESHLYALGPPPPPPRSGWDAAQWRAQAGTNLRFKIEARKVKWDPPWVAVGELETTSESGDGVEVT